MSNDSCCDVDNDDNDSESDIDHHSCNGGGNGSDNDNKDTGTIFNKGNNDKMIRAITAVISKCR